MSSSIADIDSLANITAQMQSYQNAESVVTEAFEQYRTETSTLVKQLKQTIKRQASELQSTRKKMRKMEEKMVTAITKPNTVSVVNVRLIQKDYINMFNIPTGALDGTPYTLQALQKRASVPTICESDDDSHFAFWYGFCDKFQSTGYAAESNRPLDFDTLDRATVKVISNEIDFVRHSYSNPS
jgi:hypothetical protein